MQSLSREYTERVTAVSDSTAGLDELAAHLDSLVPEFGRPLHYDGLMQLQVDCVAFLRRSGFTPLAVITRSPVELIDVERIGDRESTLGFAEIIRCHCPRMFYIGSPAGLAISEAGIFYVGLAPVVVPPSSQTFTEEGSDWRVAVTVQCDTGVVGLSRGALTLACDYGFRLGSRTNINALYGPNEAHLVGGSLRHPLPGRATELGRIDSVIRDSLSAIGASGLVPAPVNTSTLADLRRSRTL